MDPPTVLRQEVKIPVGSVDIRNIIMNRIFGVNEPSLQNRAIFEVEAQRAIGYIEGRIGHGDVTLKVVGEDNVVRTIEVIQAGRQTECFSF